MHVSLRCVFRLLLSFLPARQLVRHGNVQPIRETCLPAKLRLLKPQALQNILSSWLLRRFMQCTEKLESKCIWYKARLFNP